MKCHTCKTRMECTSDVNEINIRIDWLECPKCKSTSEVHFGNNGEYIEKAIWNR
jgi:hypothetical protein